MGLLGTDPRQLRAHRREIAIVALVVLAASAGYISLSHYGLDMLEEGFFLTTARSVQRGQLPYRDFSVAYAPGIFYVYALLMSNIGASDLAIRWVGLAGRAAMLVGMYALGRRSMSPFFAAVPPLLLLVMEPLPELWSVHPGWYSTAGVVLSALAVASYIKNGKARWLFAAGLLNAIAFAFKQNLAAFELMALLWFLVVCERDLPLLSSKTLDAPKPGRGLLSAEASRAALNCMRIGRIIVQSAAIVSLPAAALLLTREYVNIAAIGLLVLPLAALSAYAAIRIVFVEQRLQVSDWPRELNLYARPAIALVGFSAATLPWLVALLWTLKGRLALLSTLVGTVDGLAAYVTDMKPLGIQQVVLAAIAMSVPGFLVIRSRGRSGTARLATAGIGLAVALLATYALAGGAIHGVPLPAGWSRTRIWGAAAPAWSPYAGTGFDNTGVLFMYLPTLAFWVMTARLMLRTRTGSLSPLELTRVWAVGSGAALLLNQYPRMDVSHMIWSAALLLISGADCLCQWYQYLLRQLSASPASVGVQRGLRFAILLLPIVAAVPQARDRLYGGVQFVSTNVRAAYADTGARVSGGFAPVAIYGDTSSILAPADQAAAVNAVVQIVRQGTAPGEPIFAYPEIPAFYYLTDRSNPTRFNHLLSKMLSVSEQTEVVGQLADVRYVVWDSGNSTCGPDSPRTEDGQCQYAWTLPGDNAQIVKYIDSNFHSILTAGIYTVLLRNDATITAEN